MRFKLNIAACMVAIFLLSACATYYQKSAAFQQKFVLGNIEDAQTYLEHNKKQAEKKDRLLYFFDRGVVEQMLGNYESSNFYFEEAYLFTQDYRKNFTADLAEFTVNPMMKPYRGEDFEVVLIHFYKALNFIQLDRLDDALIEVRRINIRLNELNDQYEDKKNRYKQDAFALSLMGMIYEAKGNYNDAFIAYRNSYNAYKDIYLPEFGIDAPFQLKKDLLRMASYNGFRQELEDYQEEFEMVHETAPMAKVEGQLIFFWLNGLGPVKSEFSLNLNTVNGQNGNLIFANEDAGFHIPYNLAAHNQTSSDFGDLNFIRLAIPKYSTREPAASHAALRLDSSQSILFEQAEDINQIARSTLQDRMTRELAKSVGRLAIKQAAQAAANSENENLGTALSIVNAVTEKADTRNWQTLPNSISYLKVPLDTGIQNFSLLVSYPNQEKDSIDFEVNIKAGRTTFLNYHSLGSSTPIY